MKTFFRFSSLFAIVFVSCLLSSAKDKKQAPPPAPLPKQMVTAKTVFLAKGSGSDRNVKGGAELAFDTFYAEMKSWGRYRIVDSPVDADLIFELGYSSQQVGTRVWSTTNTYTGATDVHSAAEMDPKLSLNVYEPKSGFVIWSTAVPRELASLNRNREKNLLKAVGDLVANLKLRVESTPTESQGSQTK